MFVVFLLIIWPVAELFVAIKVGEAIGVLPTILLLIASVPLGMWAARSQGRSVWQRFVTAVADGRSPGRELLDGAFVLIGGVLLIVPGFITDALGALMLVPPTRALLRWPVVRLVRARVLTSTARRRRDRRPSSDVESTATDIDQPHLPR